MIEEKALAKIDDSSFGVVTDEQALLDKLAKFQPDGLAPEFLGNDLLKLPGKGDPVWTAGAGNDEVDTSALFAVDATSFRVGFMAFSEAGGAPEKVMASVMQGEHPPCQGDLPDPPPGNGWKKAGEMNLAQMTGDEQGRVLTFSSPGVGGFKSVSALVREAVAKARANGKILHPIITLGVRQYQHPKKQYGVINEPIFNVRRWVDAAELKALLTGDTPVVEAVPEDAPEPEAKAEGDSPLAKSLGRRRRRAE